jgi:hypothetical protein
MEKIQNVEFYHDDEEIIGILHEIPALKECDNMTVLLYMQECTKNLDFGTVIFHKKKVYTVYKFDKEIHYKSEADAGLLMTVSKKEYALEQLKIWQKFKESDMNLSDKIFDIISNALIGGYSIHLLYNGFDD